MKKLYLTLALAALATASQAKELTFYLGDDNTAIANESQSISTTLPLTVTTVAKT